MEQTISLSETGVCAGTFCFLNQFLWFKNLEISISFYCKNKFDNFFFLFERLKLIFLFFLNPNYNFFPKLLCWRRAFLTHSVSITSATKTACYWVPKCSTAPRFNWEGRKKTNIQKVIHKRYVVVRVLRYFKSTSAETESTNNNINNIGSKNSTTKTKFFFNFSTPNCYRYIRAKTRQNIHTNNNNNNNQTFIQFSQSVNKNTDWVKLFSTLSTREIKITYKQKYLCECVSEFCIRSL